MLAAEDWAEIRRLHRSAGQIAADLEPVAALSPVSPVIGLASGTRLA